MGPTELQPPPGPSYGKRRRRYGGGFLPNYFYLGLASQYKTTLIAAGILLLFILTGLAAYRGVDQSELLTRGRKLHREGKAALAVEAFQQLLERNPRDYDALVELGTVYLSTGERLKAERAFRVASSLKGGSAGGYSAEVARSKLYISKGEFEKAEKFLLKAHRLDPGNTRLKQAMFEMYESWGDAALQATDDKDRETDNRTTKIKAVQDPEAAFSRYGQALKYSYDYEKEVLLKEKLMDKMMSYAQAKRADKKYEEAVRVLTQSLRYDYVPETMVAIAETYDNAEQLDDAIYWFKKAHDADPETIAPKLYQLLLKKADKLEKAKKPGMASKIYDEAEELGRTSKLPVDTLYPVSFEGLSVRPEIDHSAGRFRPIVRLRVSNDSRKKLGDLQVKALFYADDQLLCSMRETIATLEKPLNAKGGKGSKFNVTMKPKDKMDISVLEDHSLRMKLFLSYDSNDEKAWAVKMIQDFKVKTGPSQSEQELVRPEVQPDEQQPQNPDATQPPL